MTEENKSNQSITKGIVAGSLIGGALFIIANKKLRQKIMKEACQAKKTSVEFISFVKENRQELLNHIRNTSNQLSASVKKINEDIKVISASVKDLRETTIELRDTTVDALDTFKETKKEINSNEKE
ncbi:YtxH domain-containing protein [Bacillus alkalicellulosilyticus]|uniref:YtxH domain-containing protein n=1 Tax=Alkalihalobacterium alkalicellulosilyticum TaxID=1912214 RepID=UPI000997C822|nr:YtxH domain-containing protein [Bacillus alkalicellulosilyticus]